MTPPANRFLFGGLLVLLALTTAVFGPVLSFDFVRWDDDINITQNPLLTDPWSGSLVARFFSGEHALRFKPFHWLLARGVHETAGLNPAAWHAFNLGLHLAATVLFYLILRQVMGQLIRRADPELPLTAEGAAWAGAALWSVHPLRAEAVSWVTASTYPLSAVCLLTSFGCYLRAHRPGAPRRWIIGAWSFAVLAYASYPVTITYGLWLIVVDCWLLPRLAGSESAASINRRTFALKHACFLLPAALAVAVTMWSRFATPGIFTTAPSVESVGIVERITMALATLTALAGRLFWPVNLTPNLPPLTGSALAPGVVALALLGAAALLSAWWGRHRRPGVFVALFGFTALSLPCLGLTERPNWPVDRYSYVVHLVMLGAVAVWLAGVSWSASARITLATLAAGTAGGLALAAQKQTQIWRDTPALFTHMAGHPNFATHPRQQGHIYLLWANEEAARSNSTRAAQLLDQAQQTYLTATQRALGRGDYAEAISLSSHLERHFGLSPTLRRERGAWLLRENRLPEAIAELKAAATALPDDERARSLLEEAAANAAASEASAPGRPSR